MAELNKLHLLSTIGWRHLDYDSHSSVKHTSHKAISNILNGTDSGPVIFQLAVDNGQEVHDSELDSRVGRRLSKDLTDLLATQDLGRRNHFPVADAVYDFNLEIRNCGVDPSHDGMNAVTAGRLTRLCGMIEKVFVGHLIDKIEVAVLLNFNDETTHRCDIRCRVWLLRHGCGSAASASANVEVQARLYAL